MRRNGNLYEYIAVYVDDLAIAAKDPDSLCKLLKEKYKYKLKGTGPISFHLGCDFFQDQEGVLCMAPRKFMNKLVMEYKRFLERDQDKTIVLY